MPRRRHVTPPWISLPRDADDVDDIELRQRYYADTIRARQPRANQRARLRDVGDIVLRYRHCYRRRCHIDVDVIRHNIAARANRCQPTARLICLMRRDA